MVEKWRDEYSEECRGKDIALLDTIVDVEKLGRCAVEGDSTVAVGLEDFDENQLGQSTVP